MNKFYIFITLFAALCFARQPVNAQTYCGEVWLLLVTNYAGTVQTFTLAKTGGTGDTDFTGVGCNQGEVTVDFVPAVDCNADNTLTFHLTITNPANFTGPFTVQFAATSSGSGPVGLAADPTTLNGPVIDIIATDPDPATSDPGYPGNFPGSDDALTAIGNVKIFDANGCEVTGLNGFTSWDLGYDKLIDCPAPPANDLCADAISIACGQTLSGTNVNATADTPPACGGGGVTFDNGVWYVFAGNGDDVTASLCNNTTFDSEIAIYSGADCASLICVAGKDTDGCGTNDESITFPTVTGTNYYIYIDGHGTATGTFDLGITCVTPPYNCQAVETAVTTADINAACGTATALIFTPAVTYTGFVAPAVLDGSLASTDPTFNRPLSGTPPAGLSSVGTAVYYDVVQFQVSTTGTYTLTNTASAIDAFSILYQNSFDPAAPLTNAIDADDDTNGNDPVHTVSLTAGVTYILVTTSFDNAEVGAYTWAVAGPGSLLGLGLATGEPVVAGYAYTYVITNSAGNIVGLDASPVDMTAYGAGTYTVCGLHYPTSGFSLPATDGTVNYSTWAAGLTDLTNATCADVSTDCITVTITCATPISISITDPCNCSAGINLDADPENELAQETITITPGTAPYTVTAVSGLVDATGVALTPATATALISGTILVAYVPANGVTTYSITIQDANTLTDSINGGPCAVCVAGCNASPNMNWGP